MTWNLNFPHVRGTITSSDLGQRSRSLKFGFSSRVYQGQHFSFTGNILLYIVFAVLGVLQRCFVLSWWNLLQSILRLRGSTFFSCCLQSCLRLLTSAAVDLARVLRKRHYDCKLLSQLRRGDKSKVLLLRASSRVIHLTSYLL